MINQAKQLDQINGNTLWGDATVFELNQIVEYIAFINLWGDATVFELNQIDEYIAFINKGNHTKVNAPSGYKKIRIHLIYDVKPDGRHTRATLVADGHLADIP
jgi:hypothetical protein